MTTQPAIFDSLFKVLESSAPETKERKPLPPDQKPDFSQQCIFDALFAAAASQHYRNDWPGQGGENISTLPAMASASRSLLVFRLVAYRLPRC